MNTESIRETLERRHEDLEETIARIQADERSVTASREADEPQEWEMAEIREGELESARQQLAEVEAALARLGRGEYGVCEKCGAGISEVRLELLPATVLCASCAAGG